MPPTYEQLIVDALSKITAAIFVLRDELKEIKIQLTKIADK